MKAAADYNGAVWNWSSVTGQAGALHHDSAQRVASEGPVRRGAVVVVAEAPAVVLGSAERADHLDAVAVAAAGFEVVRRRSGGSAVVVGPQRCLWVDLVIGRQDPLWHDDIGQAAWWVGDCWAAALNGLGVGRPVVWRGGLVRTQWSDRVCFAGLGPGEVTVEGRKVVGVAQRRTRAGALFQCAALITPTQLPDDGSVAGDGLAELASLQALSPAERAAMRHELAVSTSSLSAQQASSLLTELRAQLPGS